jgi:2-oxoglutarate ferredoxin oxidoreductase subunit alpha
MSELDFAWMAGGPQGSGVDAAANIFARACCYGGLHVYGKREYHSNIKGLHSYFHIRVSQREVGADVDRVDLLCAFDVETVLRHVWEVAPKGGIICDADAIQTKLSAIPTLPPPFWTEFNKRLSEKGIRLEDLADILDHVRKSGIKVYPVPYLELLKDLAQRIGEEKLSRVTRMTNILALGVCTRILSYDRLLVEKAISAVFRGRQNIVAMNIKALNVAYDYAARFSELGHKLGRVRTDERRIFLQGTQAVALGKIAGGCRLQTYYPITPAADESEYLEENELLEDASRSDGNAILVMQAEDEIAAINMASGAALTGVRAATSTSGPGFSLMVEGLGWAGNCEVPVVVNYYQRGAPSTGLPTRHGQDDLRFAIHAAHGEFPRIVLCSGDIEECFYDAADAFNYAEKYQTPVIHLIDKALANSSKSCRLFDLSRVRIDRGQLLGDADVSVQPYERFRFTESNISPRAPLGTPGVVMWYTGDEHDELGHISEEPNNRTRMVEKRMKKLELADKEIPVEKRVNFFGDSGATHIVVSWGSPKGAILEAMERLRHEGYRLSFLQVRMVHPLPCKYVARILGEAEKRVAVEGNYSAQLAGLVREKTGVDMDYYVLKWNGRPISSDELYESLRRIMQNRAPRRQVLTCGG